MRRSGSSKFPFFFFFSFNRAINLTDGTHIDFAVGDKGVFFFSHHLYVSIPPRRSSLLIDRERLIYSHWLWSYPIAPIRTAYAIHIRIVFREINIVFFELVWLYIPRPGLHFVFRWHSRSPPFFSVLNKSGITLVRFRFCFFLLYVEEKERSLNKQTRGDVKKYSGGGGGGNKNKIQIWIRNARENETTVCFLF